MKKKKEESLENKDDDKKEDKSNIPELTFTEDECKKITDFLEFINQKAEFTVKTAEMGKFNLLYMGMIKHIRKCESYIFEFKKTINTKD